MLYRLVLVALLGLLVSLAPSQGATVAGINTNPTWRPWRYLAGPEPDSWFDPTTGIARVDKEMPLIQQAHATYVRTEFPWTFLEPRKGVYDWTRADYIVNSASAHGVIVEPIIIFCPPWEGPYNCIPNATDLKSFLTAFAQHFAGKITVIDLWNEPDLCCDYINASLDQYVTAVVIPGYAALKAVNPNIKVVVNEGHPDSGLEYVLQTYGAKFDIFTWHDYDCASCVASNSFTLRQNLNNLGYSNVDLWVTEMGTIDSSGGALTSYLNTVLRPGATAASVLELYELRDDAVFVGANSILKWEQYGLYNNSNDGSTSGTDFPYTLTPKGNTLSTFRNLVPAPTPPPPPPTQIVCTNYYTSPIPVAAGWGAAYNVFNAGKEPVLSVDCSQSAPVLTLGSNLAGQSIYKTAYLFQNGAWQSLALTSPNPLQAPRPHQALVPPPMPAPPLAATTPPPSSPVASIDVPTMLREARKKRAQAFSQRPYTPAPYKAPAARATPPLRLGQSGEGFGAYVGGDIPDSFCQWLGTQTCGEGSTFLNSTGWAAFETLNPEDSNNDISRWVNWEQALPGKRIVTIGIPAFAWGVGNAWSSCANGAFNSHYVNLAHNILNSGIEHIDLRIAWEWNGNWSPPENYPGSDFQNFTACWRQIVNTIRPLDPNHVITFDWNPTSNWDNWTNNNFWPGDQYVDYVGEDCYANLCNSSTFSQMAAFAQSHHKKITFPESGLWGQDDPGYVQNLHDFVVNPANNVALLSQFEYDPSVDHSLMSGNFPQSSALYRQLFANYSTAVGIFPGNTVTAPQNYYPSTATATLPTTLDLTQWQFVIAYICTNVGGASKCGCPDASCTSPAWQLQAFKKQ